MNQLFGVPRRMGMPLIEEVKLRNSSHIDTGGSPFAPRFFTNHIDSVRPLIERKNSEMVKDHATIPLIPIRGSDTDSASEEIYVNNFYMVSSYYYCNSVFSMIRLIICGFGWKTGIQYCLTADDILRRMNQESAEPMSEIIYLWLKPEGIKYDPTKIIAPAHSKYGDAGKRVFASFVGSISNYVTNDFIKSIFETISRHVASSTAMLYSLREHPSLDEILKKKVKSTDPILAPFVDLVRGRCDASIKARATATRNNSAPGAASPAIGAASPASPAPGAASKGPAPRPANPLSAGPANPLSAGPANPLSAKRGTEMINTVVIPQSAPNPLVV